MDNWALITTYKIVDPPETHFRFMETFVNFYEKKWNVTKTILLVGIATEVVTDMGANKILSRVYDMNEGKVSGPYRIGVVNCPDFCKNLTYYEGLKTDILFYDTNFSTSHDEWNQIKDVLFQVCDNVLDPRYNKVINIDNDEFLCMPSWKKPVERMGFHFLEFVPPKIEEEFSWDKDMTWCEKGWYYTGASRGKNKVSHGICKKYKFDRYNGAMGVSCIHTGQTETSPACMNFDPKNIHKDNICFHLGVLDYEHYYKGKATNHDGNQMGEKHEEALKSAKDNYINFYSNPHSNFKLITDNYIKKYKI